MLLLLLFDIHDSLNIVYAINISIDVPISNSIPDRSIKNSKMQCARFVYPLRFNNTDLLNPPAVHNLLSNRTCGGLILRGDSRFHY